MIKWNKATYNNSSNVGSFRNDPDRIEYRSTCGIYLIYKSESKYYTMKRVSEYHLEYWSPLNKELPFQRLKDAKQYIESKQQ